MSRTDVDVMISYTSRKLKSKVKGRFLKLLYVGLNCKGCFYNLLIVMEKSVGKSQTPFFPL